MLGEITPQPVSAVAVGHGRDPQHDKHARTTGCTLSFLMRSKKGCCLQRKLRYLSESCCYSVCYGSPVEERPFSGGYHRVLV